MGQLRLAKANKGELWENYKDRLQAAKAAVDAEPKHENVEAWKELSREYAKKRDGLNMKIKGCNMLISDAIKTKLEGQEMLLKTLQDELEGGKSRLVDKILGLQKRRMEMIGNAMHDIRGGKKVVAILRSATTWLFTIVLLKVIVSVFRYFRAM